MNKNAKQGRAETPSNNLWVGNLSPNISDTDLHSLFSKHGPIDSVTSYPSRSYAFIYFRHVNDAKAALEALQGTPLKASPLKIEFAKPAKPCKSLWVSGIGQEVTKDVLEVEFSKFGKIEDLRFIRDRNTAYVDFFQLEDATQALKNMKGKRIGGGELHVDYLRSQPLKRDQLADHRNAREGQILSLGHVDAPLMRHEAMRNYFEPTHSGPPRQQFHPGGGQREDGSPTNVLMIRYPMNVDIDDRMLHNAMILFGEIESLKCFPLRHCAFVEFRSMDEARRAKVGLHGRLFNDPRIMIMYASNELAPEFYPGIKGARPSMYNEHPFQPAHSDMPNAQSALSRYSPSSSILGPMRPFGPPGNFAGPEFRDSTGSHKLQDPHDKSILGAPSWRRTSPAPGVLPSPPLGTKRPTRPLSAPWDGSDDLLAAESKRSRIEVTLHGSSFPFPKRDDRYFESDPLHRHGSRPVQDVHTGGISPGFPEKDYIWRGLIAKGGNPVCRARCIPIGKGIESEIPEVVNCSARTGLDLLTKHYAEAIGFDTVFFLPDCEEDFAPYTEFLNYLGDKDRAGVAKFDNGTTLFLVPPSDFLTKVLKIPGPPRLYGVVLKFSQDTPSSNSTQSQPFPTYNMGGLARLSQGEYNGIPQHKVNVSLVDYKKVDSLPHISQFAPKITSQQVASVNTTSVSQPGATLTPELIASLTSLLPANSKSSGLVTSSLLPGGSSLHPLPPSHGYNQGPPQGWSTDRQDPNQIAHQGPPQGWSTDQYNPQQQTAHHQNHPSGQNLPYNPINAGANSHVQDPPYYMPQPGGVPRPFSSFGINSQSGQHAMSSQFNRQNQNEVSSFGMNPQSGQHAISSQFNRQNQNEVSSFGMNPQSGQHAIPSQFNRQNQNEVAQNPSYGFGMSQGPSSLGSYGSSAYPQVSNPSNPPSFVHGNDIQQAQASMLAPANKEKSGLLNNVQYHQAVSSGPSQETAGTEGDKNQRYQSTLQFAANLLQQIQQQQQQQQQTGTRPGQGPANNS